MRLKQDRNKDMAAFIAAVGRNRIEMEKALRRAEQLFAARELARESCKRVKDPKIPDRARL